jgi:N12 class adenine-specific DNA methylase
MTCKDALDKCMLDRQYVDLDYIQELSGKNYDEVTSELSGIIFMNIGMASSQNKTWVLADEYLSGDLEHKLMLARASALVLSECQVNVDALEKAMQ